MSWHDQHEEARTALESGVAAVEKIPRCECGERLRDSDRGPVSSLEQHRVRMSLHAAFAFTPECPQPCEHLSQEDSRDGHTCAEHPCTC